MPEIKHQFTGGKMNKDVDERLVPNGEYRDAMNIQVSTSEGSDVGTIQNVLGNILLSDQLNIMNPSVCIGSISDEKNDTLYWFITGDAFESAYSGENPEIYPIPSGNWTGQATWPNYLSDIGGLEQQMLVSDFATKRRFNSIYRLTPNAQGTKVVQPVFIDEAGVTVAIQSGAVNFLEPSTQLELAEAQGFPAGNVASGSFLNQGLGYNYSTAFGHSFEVFDGEKIRIGDRLSMWGINPWTSEAVDFLDGYHEKYGGVTVMDKELISTWTDNNGVAKQHYVVTLSENVYSLRWNQYEGKVQDFSAGGAAAGYVIPLNLITSHLIFQQSILGFQPDTLVTGINILDDMLFWTDNRTEPKKINISRSIQGTAPSGLNHTKLVNKATDISIFTGIDILEKHITVIKKAPTTVLSMVLNTSREPNQNYSGIVKIDNGILNVNSFTSNSATQGLYDFSSVEIGDTIRMEVVEDLDYNSTFNVDWQDGTKVVLGKYDGAGTAQLPLTAFSLKGVIDDWGGNNFDSSSGAVKVSIKIQSIVGFPPVADPGTGYQEYVIDRFDESEKLFEFKFPRFSYRYKYEDNEYSSYAPFTEVGFVPGGLDYHPKKGYNVGMTNRVVDVDLMDYITDDIPLDVVQIDLLYKDDSSPNIYIVDTLKPRDNILVGNTDNFWNKNSYKLKTETIFAAVASNQLLRPWDNVPRKALAQELTGNRIVYGNYLQNYDLSIGAENFYPEFKSAIISSGTSDDSKRSIKALREYQLGVVFSDEYGRETPVMSNPTGAFKLEKSSAASTNRLKVGFRGQLTPDNLKYYKFFIKETSSEYYNVAMDRFYDAEDGNFWIAFPSVDRNKIDIDTFLVLKKGPDSASLVADEARYKVIAIENEAPDFIKTNNLNIGTITHDIGGGGDDVFGTTMSGAPAVGRNFFSMDATPFQGSSLIDLPNIKEPLYVEFGSVSTDAVSGRYRITTVATQDTYEADSSTYEFTVKDQFNSDVNFISNDPSGQMPTEINDQTTVRFYKYEVENKPQFDGRFFVKIHADEVFDVAMKATSTSNDYRILDEKKIYLLSAHQKGVHNQTNSKVFGGTSPFPNVDSNCTNYSVESTCHDWMYHQAFYTYEQVGNLVGGSWRPTEILERGTDWDDVWFIDEGFSTATNGSDNLYDSGFGNHQNNSNTDSYGVGIHDYNALSQIDLSFGPVIAPSVMQSGGTYGTGYNNLGQAVAISGSYTSGYFAQGNFPGHEMWDLTAGYQSQNYGHLTPWIERIASGSKIKWAEDPTDTVYTIFDSTTYYNRVNYEGNTQGNVFAHHQAENYRRQHRFKCVPSMSAWNPTIRGIGDAIAGSVVVNEYVSNPGQSPIATLPLIASSTQATYTGFTIKIKRELFWNSYDYQYKKRWPIARGMILVNVGGATLNPPILVDGYDDDGTDVIVTFVGYENTTVNLGVDAGNVLVFKQPVFNGLSENSAKNINQYNVPSESNNRNGMAAVGYKLQFVEEIIPESLLPEDPAIWETEPKDAADLDIYYEISGRNPLRLDSETIKTAIPIGAGVSCDNGGGTYDLEVINNISAAGNIIQLSEDLCIDPAQCYTGVAGIEVGDIFHITKLDGSSFGVQISAVIADDTFSLKPFLYNSNYQLNWHNCYSFGNGVESNRVRDNFNLPYISNGVKASSRLEDRYEEERREYGLIYSGVYNSTSGVNSLNQFIQAEKITKDVNPTYGSIQKLHSRSTADGDLITLCEDRILKILANKDAVYNADGNPQLTANENVLGQTIPFSGEYGISTNPESFASESYRVYFTDRVRGAVMRLSKDGLTAISNHGMKDWFRDNLKLNTTLIGSYDDKKEEYNISLKQTTEGIAKAVSFREDVRGWVSFKSFTPENAVSCANEYYSTRNGRMWQHNVEQFDGAGAEYGRNTFYGEPNFSTFNVILNDVPGSVKSFNTINYEGSQSKVDQLLTDSEYHNLHSKAGWYVDSIFTNKETGTINEFIEKEGKWFNYIKGQNIQHAGQHVLLNSDGSSTFDQASFAIQGIGSLSIIPVPTLIEGCTDVTASNYESYAQVESVPSSCIPFIYGCMELTAQTTYNQYANTDDGSCLWYGCTTNNGTQLNPTNFPGIAYNYSASNNIIDDGSCVPWVFGCTDITAFNYDSLANSNDGSCVPVVYGCMIELSDNFSLTANTDDGTCTWLGCLDVLASNYGWFGAAPGLGFANYMTTYVFAGTQYGVQEDASACEGGGCMDSAATNYDALALYDPLNSFGTDGAPDYSVSDGSCITCDWSSGGGAYSGAPIVSVNIADETGPNQSNGQISIEFDAYGPYLPYTFSLEDHSGIIYTTYANGQSLGGFPNANHVLFANLPADTYIIKLQGGGNGSDCFFTGSNNVVGTSAVLNFGCMDAGACNYDNTADTDNGSCDYSSCSGCTDILADTYPTSQGLQTGTNDACLTPGTFSPGPCTSSCYADANNPSGYGNGCCSYTISGCTDVTACNYSPPPITGGSNGAGGNTTVVDTTPSSCVYNGCMDTSLGMFPSILGLDINGNACGFPCQDASGVDIGYNANNYMPCATFQPVGACDYGTTGCTDSTACNFDFNAQSDDGSCVFGFVGATIGDPLAGVTTPVWYYEEVQDLTDISNTVQHYVANGYSVAANNENDVGLTIQSVQQNLSQYAPTDKVTVKLWALDANVWVLKHTHDIDVNQVYWTHGATAAEGAIFGGNRTSTGKNPYPWGTSATSAANYSFQPLVANYQARQYAVEITSTIAGVAYGESTVINPLAQTEGCGVWKPFMFNVQSACSNPYAVLGCTDSTACNEDPLATCDDGSCFFGTAALYYAGNGCAAGPGCDPLTLGTSYTSQADCYAATGNGS
tara:strand:+ start:2177 stop:10690 length:8514 start_codon:yes stop_codon:yes gene_type:complete